MIAYIDMFRDRFGVESIWRVLGATDRGFITSRGYRAAKSRSARPRARRDAVLIPVLKEGHDANYRVLGCAKCGTRWLVPAGRSVVTRLPG